MLLSYRMILMLTCSNLPSMNPWSEDAARETSFHFIMHAFIVAKNIRG